jgi:hypothetical protein
LSYPKLSATLSLNQPNSFEFLCELKFICNIRTAA